MTVGFTLGELFAGPGGMARGAHDAAHATGTVLRHGWANDYDADAVATYIKNIDDANGESVICKDVRALEIKSLPHTSEWSPKAQTASVGRMSFNDLVKVLDETDVVAIVTTKANGEQVATPIWSMVVDGVPYVRSAYGANAWWYRHVRAERPVAFVAGDGAIAERDRAAALDLPREQVTATYVPVDDAVQAKIDAEIQRKYAGQQESIDIMLRDPARECTLRIKESR